MPPTVLAEAIDDMGFEANYLHTTTSIRIDGMTCQSCVRNIQSTLTSVEGIIEIEISLEEAKGTVKFDAKTISVEKIVEHIDDMGFIPKWPYEEDIDKDFDQIAKRHGSALDEVDAILSSSETNGWITNSEDTIREVDQILDTIPSALLSSKDTVINMISESDKCVLRVSGMTCSSCVAAIERGLKKYPGVEQVLVALLAQKAEVKYDRGVISTREIIAALKDLGFGAEELDYAAEAHGECQLRVDGMSNQADASHIEAQLARVKGVLSARVDFLQKKASFKIDSEVTGVRTLYNRIKKLGYLPSPIDFQSENLLERNEANQWRRSFLLSLLFFVPSMAVMMFFMSHMSWERLWFPGVSNKNFLLFALATPAQFIGGRYFYVQAYKALKHGMANMDVLVMLATNTAYFYSVIVCLIFMLAGSNRSPKTFFETSPMLMLFISMGRWLEHKAKVGVILRLLIQLFSSVPPSHHRSL